MSKLHSLLVIFCALVFTSAHTPTRMPTHMVSHEDLAAGTTSVVSGGATTSSAGLSSSAQIAASGRFQVDASHLPKLNVDLPELFDWSDDHQSYYVDAKTFAESRPDALINTQSSPTSRVATFRDHMRVVRFGGVGGSHGSSGKGSAQNSPAADQPGAADGSSDDAAPTEQIAGLTDDANDRVFEEITQEIIAGGSGDGAGLLTNVDTTNGAKQEGDERPSEQPIPVPLPGTLLLFALGLGGFQVISRRKK